MVETAHNREDLAIEKRDFSYDLAKHALQLTLIYPVDPEKRRGIVLPQVPGVAAARRVYEPTGIALAQRGYTSLLMRHDGAGEEGIKQVRYALELASDGELDDIISDGDDIIPDGHSLGTRKVVRSLELMMRNNDDIRIKRALFSAAACLGGVHGWNAPFRTARSITAEIRYMGTIHALRQRHVAIEGLDYIKERIGAPLLGELYDAVYDNVSDGIRALQDSGVQFAAIEHPDDLLVDNPINRRVYGALDVPVISVSAPYAGHNVQLYHPNETADAIEQAIDTFNQQRSGRAA